MIAFSKEHIDSQVWFPLENCKLMRKLNCLEEAVISCEYFLHRRANYQVCSISMFSNPNRRPAHTLSTYENSSAIYRETLRRWHIYHLNSFWPSVPGFHKLTWEDHFAISVTVTAYPGRRQTRAASSHSQTPSLLPGHEFPAVERIHGTEAVLFVSSAVTVGLGSHFVDFAKCISGSRWEHKEPG